MSSPSPCTTPSSEFKETREPCAGTEQDAANSDAQFPSNSQTTTVTSATLSAGQWQAVFSPQHNAYYFHNSSTGETTWVNPLQSSPPDPSSSSSAAKDTGENTEADAVNPDPYDPNSLEARAIAAGIDPSLAYLDPSLAGPSSVAHTGSFTAKFNARTGAFTAADGRTPLHLSEYERMKRMNAFYFDVGAWEKDVEQRDEEDKAAGGKKRKRPSKKDLERFKEQKRLKKIAKTAWLRT